MRFFFTLISISVLFLKGTATVPDLTYEEALKQAAVLADSWSAQEQLIYELGERIKPETIPEVKFSDEDGTGSVTNSTAEPVGVLEKQFLEEVFDELGQPTKPLDESIYLVQFNASESYIDESTPIYTFDTKTLSCKGEGSNGTLTGYCKSSSLCTSFGGEAIGLCWRNHDVTAVCCQPSPDSFFPIPRVDETEVDIIRLRRSAGLDLPDGDMKTYSKYVTSSIQDTSNYLSECSHKMKSIKYPTDSAVYRLSQRLSGTGDINAAGNAMLNLLLAAKYILKKYPTWTVQQALAVVTASDLGKKSLERYCIAEPNCEMYAKWRTFDGSCNNIKDPLAGKAGTPMIRLLPAYYQDGILSLRGDYQQKTLPNGRYISAAAYSGKEIQEKFWSTTVMDFGQFVNHDIALSPNLAPYNDEKDIIKCCKADGYGMLAPPLHPACIPIIIPANDKIYAPNKINCLNLVRSAMGFDTDCYLTPAQQVAGVSTWLDGSQIYGTTDERAQSLRAFYGGLLKVSTYKNDPYLPVTNGESCYAKQDCKFLTGDTRSDQTAGLNHMHLLWMRHHNYIAKVLYEINPWWGDERLYQEARRIIIAQYQYIVYEEFLAITFGADTLKKAGLELGKKGFTYNYNPKLKAGTVNDFVTFGFRYGHSQVLDDYWLMSALYPDMSQAEGKKRAKEIALSDNFFLCPNEVCMGPDAYKRFWYGVAMHETYTIDTDIEASMHHELFKKKGAKVGLDIIATDIYRGRDHGLQPYYKYVEYCQHVYINSWSDLIKYGLMTDKSVKILSYLYKSVKDVDAFVGASYEVKPKGYFMGRTFACITLQTFKRLRDTDRYFYSEKNSNPGVLTKEQLHAIQEKTSLSGIICEASMNSLQHYVPKAFFTPNNKFNPVTPCSKIKKLEKADLLAWYEPPPPKISAGVCQMVDSYGKVTFGTCLIPSHCESSYSKDYPTSKYKSYACPKGLQCCKGNPGVLRAHIKYSEPTIDQYKQFYKLEATALSQAITTVQNSDESLYVSVQSCGDSYVDGYGQIRYLLSSHLYTDDQQTKIALDSITAQFTFKYIINALNTPQYGKGYDKKGASYQKTAYAVAASTFYGILWKDLEAKLYVCFTPHPCDCYHPYRTASGDCTSKKAPDLGITSLSQYLATSLTSYKDGINQYPVAAYGSLPNPRVLSVQLVTKKSNYLSKTFSLITPYFMKLVANDIFQAAFFKGISLLDCCDTSGKSIDTHNPSCAAINLGNYYDKDPVFGRLKISCIPVLKKVPGLLPGCSVQRNSAMNVATSLLDGSVIYGNSQADEKRIRTYSRGLIIMETKTGDKLPILADDPALLKKFGKICNNLRPCKLVAWSRGNGHPEMLPFVALFYREHNRLAKILAQKYPYWTDNEIYHEAKAINIGQFETVVIQELVEALLGDDLVKYYKLRLEDLEYLVEYQNPLDVIGPSDQAGTLAWRMVWHNMLRPTGPVPLYPAAYGKKQDPNLFDTWFYLLADDRKADSRVLDLYFQTLLSQYAENVDTYVFAESEGAYRFKESTYGAAGAYEAYKDSYSEEVTVAWDNIAQLIQDSRVDGVGSYNDYREACGYPRAKTIDDMYDLIYDKGRISKLKYAYKSADDVDLVMGLWYETPKSKNTPLGGVTICLIAHMVKDWMLQDNRFFNHPKNPRKFTKDQIKAISHRTLASIMCDNTEYIDAYRPGYFAEFTKNVFLWQSSYNPLKSCKDLPKLTLAEWNYKTSILTAYDTNYAYKMEEYKTPSYELYGHYASSYKAPPPDKYPSGPPAPPSQYPSHKQPDTYTPPPKNYPTPNYKPTKVDYPKQPSKYVPPPKDAYPATKYPSQPKPPTPSYPASPPKGYQPAPKKKAYPEAKPAKPNPAYKNKNSGSYEA